MSLAATLSFVWPGLGQLYLGRGRAAIGYAVPVLLVFALIAAEVSGGLTALAVKLLDPSFALTLLLLVLLVGAWRLLSIIDAGLRRNRNVMAGSRTGRLIAVLIALTVGIHGIGAFYLYSFYTAGSKIFVGQGPGGDRTPGGSGDPEPTDMYDVPPFEAPKDGRVTILLTGVDKATSRTQSLTDTLLLVSIDPSTKSIAMISFPRDIARFPLYGGGTYNGKINSLMSYASRHPDEFPDGPLPTVAKELGYLLGVPVNYFAAVDLDGFETLIDVVGGVWVDVERPINDPLYLWIDGGPPGFKLAAGRQKLDARTALAFVRSRQGVGDTDFTRAARQQQLLVALRDQLTSPENVGLVPAVLDVAADTVRTNLPPDQLDELIALAQSIESDSIRRIVLQPPLYSVHPPTKSTGGTYILTIKEDAVRQLSVELFGADSAFWSGEFDTDGSPVPMPAG